MMPFPNMYLCALLLRQRVLLRRSPTTSALLRHFLLMMLLLHYINLLLYPKHRPFPLRQILPNTITGQMLLLIPTEILLLLLGPFNRRSTGLLDLLPQSKLFLRSTKTLFQHHQYIHRPSDKILPDMCINSLPMMECIWHTGSIYLTLKQLRDSQLLHTPDHANPRAIAEDYNNRCGHSSIHSSDNICSIIQ